MHEHDYPINEFWGIRIPNSDDSNKHSQFSSIIQPEYLPTKCQVIVVVLNDQK